MRNDAQPRKNYGLIASLVLLLPMWSEANLAQPAPDDPQKWLEGDEENKALQVNEGSLAFLATPPKGKKTHSVVNTITISNTSLKSHWVDLYQCHKNLDPVAASEIVYSYHHIRNLRIEHYYGMEKAWIEKQSVQMQNIGKGASLCVIAQVQILMPTKDGGFRLRNGPYFRKFLDGYYPFHLKLKINYPSSTLSLQTTTPSQQSGFNVLRDDGKVIMDAWFEGKLAVEARFSQIH